MVGLVCWLVGWFVGLVGLVCWFGWFVWFGLLFSCLVWFVGWFVLDGWFGLDGWFNLVLLVGWLVGWLVGLVGKSVDTCLQSQAHMYVCIHFVCVTCAIMRAECMKENTIIMSGAICISAETCLC